MKHVMEASHAISEAVKALKPAVVAAYPITPQTHIVERISDFVANGEIDAHYIRVESEFSAISACLGASAVGVRSYTSTSSQGLALMNEILFIVSGMRLPVLMSVVNRSLSAPINIWNDHQDSISERDTGWLQFYAETGQESYDLSILQAKISEDSRVLLPSMVCMDGFTLSHVYEPIDIPDMKAVQEFLPDYKPVHAFVDPDDPITQGPIGFPSHYMEFRHEQQLAMEESLKVIEEAYNEFNDKFPIQIINSRPVEYGHVEEYQMQDAEIVFIAMGSVCGTIKVTVDKLRAEGEKVGLLKLITYRPFPKDALAKSLKGVEKVMVMEKAFSPGMGGVVYSELIAALYERKMTPDLRNFIIGLGGRDVTVPQLKKAYEMTKKDEGKKEEWLF